MRNLKLLLAISVTSLFFEVVWAVEIRSTKTKISVISSSDLTANLWVDTNGGACTRQATAGVYVDAAACSSIQAAVAACVAGDTIRMKAGSYGNQTIAATKTAPGCTVIAEAPTTVGALTTNGAWYEIQNISGTGWDISAAGTNNITCRGCNFSGNSGVWWAANGWSNIRWIGGSLRNFSCSTCANGMAIFASNDVAGTSTATDILVDSITFDNIVNTGGNVNHFEVIRVDGNVNGLTIRNSTFTNNVMSTSLFFFTTFRGTKPQNITLENNFFGGLGTAYYSLNMNFQGSSCSNWTIRYNTFLNSMMGGADGFHLTAGSPAIDGGGSGTDCIATDHDKNSRPAGLRCDAGALEFGTR